MRVREFLTTKSFITLLTFVVVAVAASFVPSPWREGPLLNLSASMPIGFSTHQPLILWPEDDAGPTESFHIDFSLDGADPASDAASSSPRAHRAVSDAPTHNAGVTPPPQAQGEPATADTSRSNAPSPDVPGTEPDGAQAPNADPPAFEVGSHGPFFANNDPYAAAWRQHHTAARKPAATPDARDHALLASLRKLREQLPQKPNHLEIPCQRLREYPDGSPVLETQEALENGQCTRKALDHFYASLRQRALKEAGLTRWSQYGDSLVVGDTLTGELRRLFQQQFGDGGHGFVFIGQPLRVFGFENIRIGATEAWNVRTIVRHAPEGGDLFGLGGAEFRAKEDSSLMLQSPRNDVLGKELEQFHVLYFAPPSVESGYFRFTVDGETRTERFDVTPGSSGMHTVAIPRGEHRVQFSGFSPHLRYYGIISETSGPGVVVDNLGQVSAREEHLLKINPEQWRDQLALRDPDLVAFFYGVNAASSSGSRINERDSYADNYREVIRRATTGAPERDCLVLSLLTRGTREGGSISPTGAVAVLNREQRRAALSSGCAFFDTTAMMGGPNGTRRWAEGNPTLLGADLAHPTPAGYKEIARRLYADIMDGFIDYMERRIGSGGSP